MKIAELFYSIQGEGKRTGVPSVFIRLAGCNLACSWCDTPYASRPEKVIEQSIDEILAETERYACPFFVLTGGEPMLAEDLPELVERLKEKGKHITIETNATIPPGNIACDLASLSPKLKHSLSQETLRLQPDIIRAWILSYPYQLKFVVQQAADLVEIEELLTQVDINIPAHRIMLMPESQSSPDLEWILEACKQHGFRYCHRLQYDLFDNRKGY